MSTIRRRPAALLDLDFYMPYGSPCGICGGTDSRHRLFDAVKESLHFYTVEETSNTFGLDPAAVRLINTLPVGTYWR